MDFRIKCLLQTLFGVFPNSENLNYLAQKHLARSLPLSHERYKEIYGFALHHHDICRKYVNEKSTVIYEIGCGWDLSMALIFSSLGYKNIIALDTVCHARQELINTIIGYMKEDGLISDGIAEYDVVYDIKEKLLSDFGITYLAPCDSADTGLEDKSVDFIFSHLVFEHIPADIIPNVMTECRRILRDNGVISLVIDYADHYRTFDKKITPYNFLKYPEDKWCKYNPKLHYVNRLRHKDYIAIFKQTGFDIIEETVFRPDNAEETVRSFPFDDQFSTKYTRDELSITYAYITLKKMHNTH